MKIHAIYACIVTLLVACATPAQRINILASQLNLTRSELTSGEFQLVVYENTPTTNQPVLHIYLEGDGTPWIHKKWVAADPTTRNPLMLRLLAIDPKPSLYLGRPCYYGKARNEHCNPLLWTHQRYSEKIVAIMANALRQYLANHNYSKLIFIGHSGGGTLAMLLAPRFPETTMVITLAGNLDIDAWAQRHNFSPLTGSLNPATQPPLPPHISQLHIAAERDKTIPPSLIKQALQRQPNASFSISKGLDHSCCWQTIWPNILKKLDKKGL